jgi:acyl-CoA thioesterase
LTDRSFYTPIPTHNPMRFHFPVETAAVVGPPERQFMMGGVGLGSAIVALEQATGRPLIWATAQYLSFAPPGSVVDIDVHVPVAGNTVTQARVISHVGEREIITVNAALGSREGQPSEQYVTMPDVPPPDECPAHTSYFAESEDLITRLDQRDVMTDSREHPGQARMWIRTIDDEPVSAGLLAVFADFLAGATEMTRGSSSLDNTLRLRELRPTRWCLLDARIQGLGSGFFHGELCIFAEDGTLLATASQSGALPRRSG